jgi:hypothetical protein
MNLGKMMNGALRTNFKQKVFLLAFLFLMVLGHDVHAQFLGWGGEKIVKIADLPDTPEYAIDGNFADAGIIYKKFTFCFVPLFNYNKRWCLFSGTKYIAMEKNELDKITAIAGITLPGKMKIPFFDAWGGKIIGIIILGIFILYMYIKADLAKQKEEEKKKAINAAAAKLDAALKAFPVSNLPPKEVKASSNTEKKGEGSKKKDA